MINATLFDFTNSNAVKRDFEPIAPVEPKPLDASQWPPNYAGILVWRGGMLQRLRNDQSLLREAKRYYATRPSEFINDWFDTYDPRRVTNKWIPFVFFKRQDEFISFLDELRISNESGLIEKGRDMGATWACCAYSVWAWLFVPEVSIGWGSRKQDLVDRIGEPDSIFEKMRLLINRLPDIWLPNGWQPKDHATYMKLINPENGATITGEAGDNIGRGGRKTMYFKDESAHYERPEKIEAALGDNTNVQIDISSVNGLGNVFHRRREAGETWAPGRQIAPGMTRVFVMDWREHPEKTQDWYDKRRAKYEREGMLHLFKQEVDRDYSAAVLNTVISMEWINAAVDAHLHIVWRDDAGVLQRGLTQAQLGTRWGGALDVADGGLDKNAGTLRQGILWRYADHWGARDVAETTRRMADLTRLLPGIDVQYDSIGVGAGVKAEYNRLVDEKIIDTTKLRFVAWNAGAAVQNPAYRVIEDDEQSILNVDMFENLKAQAWFAMRSRFWKTFRNVKFGDIYPIDEMISIDGRLPLLHQIKKELAQVTMKQSGRLKTMIEKAPDGTFSPNIADAGVMMYFPLDPNQGAAVSAATGA